jgi:hypothetical protein
VENSANCGARETPAVVVRGDECFIRRAGRWLRQSSETGGATQARATRRDHRAWRRSSKCDVGEKHRFRPTTQRNRAIEQKLIWGRNVSG